MKNRILGILLFCSFVVSSSGQLTKDYSTGVILQKLEKLNTLGSVLYVAAHPDDENTQFISYMANGRHYRTGYLAATRGDGGQNLIGPEIREALGVLRTQELLAARQTDGGEQFFSRANDFGYSKHPDETFNVWNREQVLADFVWSIRNFQPDILVTRFSQEPGASHGHHTASAILAMEAFKLSGDSTAFPEQLRYVDVWQPAKIYYNIGLWSFRRSGKEFNEDGYLKLDVGGYNTNLGMSYTEISAFSRSMHKSQGFGSSGSRGSEFEYFQQWGGTPSEGDLFDGINTSWDRVAGTEEVRQFVSEAINNFNPMKPSDILEPLMNARSALLKVPDQYWKEVKLAELRELIVLVSGTYMEVFCRQPAFAGGDTLSAEMEIINRSDTEIILSAVNFKHDGEQFIYNLELAQNENNVFNYDLVVPENIEISHPYWLRQKGTTGTYRVDDQTLIGRPQSTPELVARVTLKIDDQFLDYEVPIIYKTTDPVKGEVKRIVEITPRAMVNLDSRALVFVGNEPKNIEVVAISGSGAMAGTLKLDMPNGWTASPAEQPVSLERTGQENSYTFTITPPEDASEATITASLEVGNKAYNRGKSVLAYDHVPTQTVYAESEVRVVKLPAKKLSGKIGYIMGAGDEIPFSLTQIGYSVDVLEAAQVNPEYLAKYKAVILGVRAFNTLPWLAFKNEALFDYTKNGGTVIVQYNTSYRLVTEDVAPYPLTLSRDRVTVEGAPVTFLNKKHRVLQQPFKLSKTDFDDWVQERGLYFPSQWPSEFEPILGMNDPGEEMTKGSLLIAQYGKGYYCYTGISFFRELPAGVSGAYKLLVNMISLGDN